MNSIITIIVAVVITFALALLLHKITYHINYVIILTSLILVFVLAGMIHLPALLLVKAFGMALENYRLSENTFLSRYIQYDKFGNDLASFT